jgi:uncharacterized SAM-binding protein YcdF (DUF218 family)
VLYLHKILPVLFLPLGIALVLFIVGLLLRRRYLCWLGVIVLWLASTPIVSDSLTRVAEGWQERQAVSEVPEAQAIVVLSAGRVRPPGNSGVSEWGDADRFYGGIDLFQARRAPILVFTGGWVPWEPDAKLEGDVLVEHALRLGVPRDRILTTSRVSTTEEESRAVSALLAERSSPRRNRRIILVTSAMHMRRAELLFSRAGLVVVPFPVDFRVPAGQSVTPLAFLPSGSSLGRSESALRELYGFTYYRFF